MRYAKVSPAFPRPSGAAKIVGIHGGRWLKTQVVANGIRPRWQPNYSPILARNAAPELSERRLPQENIEALEGATSSSCRCRADGVVRRSSHHVTQRVVGLATDGSAAIAVRRARQMQTEGREVAQLRQK